MRRSFSISFLEVTYLAVIFVSHLSLLTVVSTQNATKRICQTTQCLFTAQNFKESINFKINPCDDFYEYACGNWPHVHKNVNNIPKSSGRLRNDENNEELHGFLKQNNTKDEPEAVHKARQLYALCLNKAAYSNKSKQIEIILQKIGITVLPFLSGEIKNYDYTTVLAKAAKLAGIKMYFDLKTSSNPYNSSLKILTLGKIGVFEEIDPTIMPLTSKSSMPKQGAEKISEDQFVTEVMRRMCENSNSTSCAQWNSPNNVTGNIMMEKILNQSVEIAQINAKSTAELNSSFLPDIFTLKQLQDLTDSIAILTNTTIPKLNWTRYIEETLSDLDAMTLNLSDPTAVYIVIESLDFITEIIHFIYKTEKVKLIELGLWWEVVSNLLPYVDLKIFDLKNKVENSEVPESSREQRCAEITKLSFGMAVSYVYATKEKYIEAKIEIGKMFENIRDSLKQTIQEVSWMDETTKQRALKKLQSVKSYLVYPNAIKTHKLNEFYRDVNITSNFYDTMITRIQNRVKKTLNQLNQFNEQNEDDWIATPNIVDALNQIDKNAISIVGLSMYSHSLRAVDYGAIGTVIGHELTHAFDNTGRHYNEIGNIEDWWQPETSNLFAEKAECFVKAYANYSTNFGGIPQMADSKVTLGEDISDNGGFKESLFAYRKSVSKSGEEPLLPQFENFTHEQLFTLAYANLWCENPTMVSTLAANFSDHSPHAVRVNGVVQNSKEFAEIWKCPKGSKMNPNNKCSIW